jgi:tetratricopeptide (TPR) repeat protein
LQGNSVSAADLNEQLTVRLNNGTYGKPRDKADQLLQLGKLQESDGQWQEAVQSCQQALMIYQDIGDREAESLTYGYLAFGYAQLGQYAALEDAYRRRLALARDRQDFQTQIYVLNNLGRFFYPRGGSEVAEKLFIEALQISTNIKSLEGQALSHDSLGLLALNARDYNRATQEFQQSLSASRKGADIRAQATTLNNLGDVYKATGRLSDSMKYYALAFRLADLAHDRANQYRAIDGMVTAYNASGSYKQSVEMLNERLEIAQDQENPRQQLASLQALAQLYQQLGDYPRAKTAYAKAIVIARNLKDVDQENILVERLVGLTRNGGG